jgi:hypothetical protein
MLSSCRYACWRVESCVREILPNHPEEPLHIRAWLVQAVVSRYACALQGIYMLSVTLPMYFIFGVVDVVLHSIMG